MPTATVRLANKIADNVIDCAVRIEHQGRASIELCTDDLGIVPRTEGAPTWHSLAFVMNHRDVRAVTFRGPWSGDYAAPEWPFLLSRTDVGATDDYAAPFGYVGAINPIDAHPEPDDDEPPGYSAGIAELGYEGDG